MLDPCTIMVTIERGIDQAREQGVNCAYPTTFTVDGELFAFELRAQVTERFLASPQKYLVFIDPEENDA